MRGHTRREALGKPGAFCFCGSFAYCRCVVGANIPLDWARLTPEEKVRHCRDFAAEAIAIAESKPVGSREPYLRLAADWLKLAKDIEHANTGRPSRM